MRLERLDLTRYGRFTDKSLSFAPPALGDPDLHIIYGPNEAGKSTLFSAWLDLLFGIPLRSRYDFLHPGPTMQIGTRLTHATGTLELRRLKRNNASLLDGHETPLPENILQSVLGGLSRDSYSAMFSLDDDTLEKGGDSILASRGDLGEMLFSASSGLAELAPRMESLRGELDSFHRSGKRSGWLYEAKKQLADLDARRRGIEVSASALQKLAREAAAAEQAWREARAREDATQAELARLGDIAAALPLLAKLADLQDRLHPTGHLPDADTVVQESHARIERDRLTLDTRISDRALRLQGVEDRLAALPDDPAVLARSDEIDSVEALRPEHDTAIKDLPRRQQEAGDAQARIRALLSELGQGGARAADLVLPSAVLARMRSLLSERSGLLTAVATAAAETRKAADLLARERDRLGSPDPVEDDAALSALLTRLRAQDPADGRTRALRDRDQAEGRLSAAIVALAPWRGDGDSLAALAVPPGWQIREWEVEGETARQQELDTCREVAALQADLDRLQAAMTGRAEIQAATGLTLSDAAVARSRREALWAEHLGSMSPRSAYSFEQALREDDRISALLAEALAEARREALQRTERDQVGVRLEDAKARLAAVRDRGVAIGTGIDAACAALGLTGGSLPDLQQWLDLRLAALTERHALRDAEAALRRSTELLDSAARALATALGQTDDSDARDYDTLLTTALARVDATDRRREARRRLTGLASDLREREQAEREACAALTGWRQDWAEASRETMLARHPDDASGLGAILDLLDQLGTAARDLSMLEDRIAKMQANRDRFQQARSGIALSLDMPEAAPWGDVLSRLRRARDRARDREELVRQRDAELQSDKDDRRALELREQEAADLGASLGWSGGDCTLADHIACCLEATKLRRDIATLQDELRDHPRPGEMDDPGTIRQRIESLKADAQLLRRETEFRLEAHLEAKRQIEAVGGDDALARIASDRQNLLLEIRERARDHLAARFGLMAFETGLRRYRDQHRSAMLARASEAFRKLTVGAYSGLATQPDGTSEILVALSTSEGAKLAPDLSKGARFQLYLALRIAGYHELATSRPSVPFIADDIMETFDDHRASAAFALLSDMSRLGQVIYLTHHRHLCDIALTACPAANVIDLQSL